jgi:hypothetical protein
MTNLIRSNFQAHPFHLVSPSPWPLFTCIALFTLTTSGVSCFMPDSYLAICWNILQNLVLFTQEIIGGQSAGNLLSLNFLGILRDYMLGFFCCTIPIIVEKSSLLDNKIDPVVTYNDAGSDVKSILRDNRGKCGVYL